MLLLISSYREVAVQPRSRLCAWVCVFVRVHPVSVIGRGCENAGRSICSGWCQQTVPANSDSISAGICGNWRERGGRGVRREEEQQEQEGTLEGLFLWVTVLLVLSPLVPLIENQTEKKICRFLLLVSPISLSCSTSPSFILVFIEPPPLFLYYWLRYEAVMEISFLDPKYFPSVTIKPAYHDSAHICVIAQV